MQIRAILPSIAIIALLAAACSSPEPAAEAAPPEPAETTVTADADYVPAEQVADIPIERVEFDPGSNAVTVEDSITGYQSVDYVVKVDAGQPMNLSMATAHTATYFNLIEPGETDAALHIGSIVGNQYEGVAEKSGDYRIRVYMMRSAARREETADYRLEIIVG